MQENMSVRICKLIFFGFVFMAQSFKNCSWLATAATFSLIHLLVVVICELLFLHIYLFLGASGKCELKKMNKDEETVKWNSMLTD